MNSQLWFLVSLVTSFLSFALIAEWYVVSRLRGVPRITALLPLLLVHTFRADLYPS